MVRPETTRKGNLQENGIKEANNKKKPSTAKGIPEQLFKRMKRAKIDDIVAKMRAENISEHGVNHFVNDWKLESLVRQDGKQEWNFRQPNKKRTCHSVPEVINWFKTHLGDVNSGASGRAGAERSHGAAAAGSQNSEATNAGSGPSGAPETPAEEAHGDGGNAPGMNEDIGGDEDPDKADGAGEDIQGDGEMWTVEGGSWLPQGDSFKFGASCLVASFKAGFTKLGAVCTGVAAESWSSGRVYHARKAAAAARAATAEKAAAAAARKAAAAAAAAAVVQESPVAGLSAAPAPATAAPKEVPRQVSPRRSPRTAADASETAPTGSSTGPKTRAQKRKAGRSPEVASETATKPAKLKAAEEEEEEFEARKHVVRNMTVLLRTEDDSASGWNHAWSVAHVTSIDKTKRLKELSVKWLKPASEEEDLWSQRWVPWTVEVEVKKAKRGRNMRSGEWNAAEIDIDTVQWGTFLDTDSTFHARDREIMRCEAERLDAAG